MVFFLKGNFKEKHYWYTTAWSIAEWIMWPKLENNWQIELKTKFGDNEQYLFRMFPGVWRGAVHGEQIIITSISCYNCISTEPHVLDLGRGHGGHLGSRHSGQHPQPRCSLQKGSWRLLNVRDYAASSAYLILRFY